MEVLSPAMTARARDAIRRWPGYAPTPLRRFDRLAEVLGLGAVHYKDESARFGLGSFKPLGGAYAVLHLLAQRSEERRAGKGCVGTCRFRGAPDHEKKKNNKQHSTY